MAISDDSSSSAMHREHRQEYVWEVFYLWFQFSSFPTPALSVPLPLRTSRAKPDKLIRNYIQDTVCSFISLPPASLILHLRDHCSWSFLPSWCWGFRSNPLLLEGCFISNLSTFPYWYQWVDHLEFKKWEKNPFYSQVIFGVTGSYTCVILGQALVSVSWMWRCLFSHHLLKYIHLAVTEQLLIQAFPIWTRKVGEFLKLVHRCFLEFYAAGTSGQTSRWWDRLLQVCSKWVRRFSAMFSRRFVYLFLQGWGR